MKIIQTLWLPNNHENPISFTGGWLSAEYHWLSWTLSVLQLRKFYDEVELFTTKAGKEVLINQLNLPYTKVHVVHDDTHIPPSAWALSKIITYSLQNEPFLHIDGDVYIWKPFDETLLQSPLIAQNQEYDFAFYHEYISNAKFQAKHLPEVLQKNVLRPFITYNAGIFGGNDIEFIKKYAHIAIDFIRNNPEYPVEQSSEYCMFFEQCIFSILVQDSQISVNTFFKEVVDNELYKGLGLADFWETPQPKTYLHLMGMSKKNRMILKKMLCKIRKDYPEYYYKTLRLCQKSGIVLDFKVYQQQTLNPSAHSVEYFRNLSVDFVLNEKTEKQNRWVYLYAKDDWIYDEMEKFMVLSEEEKFNTKLFLTNDFQLIEEENPELKQSLRVEDTFSIDIYDHEMEELEMILIDTFDKTPKTLNQIIIEIQSYFDSDDFIENQALLKELILPKVIHFMSMGVVCVAKD
jgi:hypothetical protein